MNVDELEERAVCCVGRDRSPQLTLEIRDRFWPYQRQPSPERSVGPEAEFVDRVRGLFLAPACVQASFSAADEKLALDMYRRGVSMEQITRAILLGCARKYVAMLNAGTRTPITSLQYFADIVEEVNDVGDSRKLLGAAPSEDGADGTTMAASKSSKNLMPKPVGQPPAAPHHQGNGPHHRNAGPHETESWPTSNGIHNRATRQGKKRNDAN